MEKNAPLIALKMCLFLRNKGHLFLYACRHLLRVQPTENGPEVRLIVRWT